MVSIRADDGQLRADSTRLESLTRITARAYHSKKDGKSFFLTEFPQSWIINPIDTGAKIQAY